MATPDIIFYTAKVCPYAQRVEIAFQEAKADVTRYSIDLLNKPEWYASRVNPASKVPAVVYGSEKSDPENPSPESARVTESAHPARVSSQTCTPTQGYSRKTPSSAPVSDLHRCAIDQGLPALHRVLLPWRVTGCLIAAVAEIQEAALPPAAQFAVGDHLHHRRCLRLLALRRSLAAGELLLRSDLGKFEMGTGLRVYKELFQSERFARLQKYYANISRP
ncbi:hypothetical protein EDB87DRAFT_1764539 [Lactarius vividus]|nr:hypothetical protein EDB87DRAFT_1764539 [Lactarius vividus]